MSECSAKIIGISRLVTTAYVDPAYCRCFPSIDHCLHKHVTFARVLDHISWRMQRHDSISSSDPKPTITVVFSDTQFTLKVLKFKFQWFYISG